MLLAFAVLAAAVAASPAPRSKPAAEETKISIDVKDADIVDVVRLLSEVAGFQTVVDGGVSCKLTLKLNSVPWPTVLDLALKSCGIGYQEDNGVVRVAPTAKLMAEAQERRKLEEAREQARPRQLQRFRLSYARAAEMAPLVKQFLSPQAEVFVDARTNTLFIKD